jgi:hypothetical protein
MLARPIREKGGGSGHTETAIALLNSA